MQTINPIKRTPGERKKITRNRKDGKAIDNTGLKLHKTINAINNGIKYKYHLKLFNKSSKISFIRSFIISPFSALAYRYYNILQEIAQ